MAVEEKRREFQQVASATVSRTNSAHPVGVSARDQPPHGLWSASQRIIRFLRPPQSHPKRFAGDAVRERLGAVERRDWWLWLCAIFATLPLSAVLSFGLPEFHVLAQWSARGTE